MPLAEDATWSRHSCFRVDTSSHAVSMVPSRRRIYLGFCRPAKYDAIVWICSSGIGAL
jgi:hypothetical protein